MAARPTLDPLREAAQRLNEAEIERNPLLERLEAATEGGEAVAGERLEERTAVLLVPGRPVKGERRARLHSLRGKGDQVLPPQVEGGVRPYPMAPQEQDQRMRTPVVRPAGIELPQDRLMLMRLVLLRLDGPVVDAPARAGHAGLNPGELHGQAGGIRR